MHYVNEEVIDFGRINNENLKSRGSMSRSLLLWHRVALLSAQVRVGEQNEVDETLKPSLCTMMAVKAIASALDGQGVVSVNFCIGPPRCQSPGSRRVEQIKILTRRYAKQQRTWLKRFRVLPNTLFIDMKNKSMQTAAKEALKNINAYFLATK